MSTLVNSEPRRLYRSHNSRLVAGVASGVAGHLGISTAAMRLAFVLLVGVSQLGLVLYVALWMVLPAEGQATRVLPRELRLILGGILIAVAVVGGGMLATVLLIGIGFVTAKLLRRAAHRLQAERLRRIREQRRTQLALVIQDQVLQTLALVQRNAADSESVQRLISAQGDSLRRLARGHAERPRDRPST